LPGTKIILRVGLRSLFACLVGQRNEIEHGGRKMRDGAPFLMGHIARHGQSLQVNFGPHDRGAEIEQYAPFEAGDALREDQEIAVAGGADGRAVSVRVLVDDVVTDTYVHGYRYSQPVARS